jgi:ABC-type branched-chain amino acid transport systems, periplasmic component
MRFKITFAAALLASTLMLTACGSGDVGADGDAGDPVRFGYLMPETGSVAVLGGSLVAATRLAVDDINAGGGILGGRVDLVGADTASDPTVAAQALDRLLSRNVLSIMGTGQSAVSLSLLDKVVSSRTLMCSGADTALEFTSYPDENYHYRTSTSNLLQAIALASLMEENGSKRVAVVGRGDAFGQGLVDELESNLGSLVAERVIYDPLTTSFEAEVRKIREANVDAVALIGYAEMGEFVQTMIENGLTVANGVQLYGVNQLASNVLWEAVDPSNQGVLKGLKGVTNPKAYDDDFSKRLLEANPDLKQALFAAEQYDCAIITALAAVAAGSTNAAEIKNSVADVTRGGEDCNSFKDCVTLLKTGTDIRYVGPSGPKDMSDAGDPTVARFATWTMDDKSQVQLDGGFVCEGGACTSANK